MKEVWKDIPKYKGYYQVSNLGRVKSCSRILKVFNRHKICDRKYKERILKHDINKEGYHKVSLSKNNKIEVYRVSRLVLICFDRKPKINEEACHFPDHNKSNNRIDNLKWGTPKENSLHRIKHGTMLYGEKAPMVKLDNNKVKIIRNLSKTKSTKDICSIFNVHKTTIQRIINNKTWKNIK